MDEELKAFRVIAGVHKEDGVRYLKGSVIRSDKDLDRIFLNKFQRLRMDDPALLPDEPVEEDLTAEEVEAEVAAAAGDVQAPKRKRRNLLEKIHKGGGRWEVRNRKTNERINDEWLTKEEAESIVKGRE